MDKKGKTGAISGSDRDTFSYTSLPLLALIGVARTATEGATKYGRLNYKQGTPSHEHIDHAFHHLVMDQSGDRSEPNLEHAIWRLMAAIESRVLHPELNSAHDLGPGGTITPEAKAHLEEQAPDLAARRKAGEFAAIGNWRLADLHDVRRLLKQRDFESVRNWDFASPEPYCVADEQEFCPCDKCSYLAEEYDQVLVSEMSAFLSADPIAEELAEQNKTANAIEESKRNPVVAEVTRADGTNEPIRGRIDESRVTFDNSVVMNNGDTVRMLSLAAVEAKFGLFEAKNRAILDNLWSRGLKAEYFAILDAKGDKLVDLLSHYTIHGDHKLTAEHINRMNGLPADSILD